MDKELNASVYRLYLHETQLKIKSRQEKLLEIINKLQKKKPGLKFADNLLHFSSLKFTPIIIDEYQDVLPAPVEVIDEEVAELSVVSKTKTTLKDIKEPIFDESQLSDVGKLMLEAVNKGIPFKMPKIEVNKTPQTEKLMKRPPTPGSTEEFVLKTNLLLLPTKTRSTYNRVRAAAMESCSPDLETAVPVFKFLKNDSKCHLPIKLGDLFNKNEDEVEVPPEKNPISSLVSPQEPQLENFQSYDNHNLVKIIKTPESPELSEELMNLVKRIKENK
ncbi:hypothetical protein CHUAL_000095 [Chamberlinius hualienensis]